MHAPHSGGGEFLLLLFTMLCVISTATEVHTHPLNVGVMCSRHVAWGYIRCKKYSLTQLRLTSVAALKDLPFPQFFLSLPLSLICDAF